MTITWEQILAFLCEDQTMAITSLLFLAFFAAVALINYALPRVLRPYFLLLASYGFFCYDPVNRPLVWVMAAATLITWLCGLIIGKVRCKPVRILALLASVGFGIGILVYYKYWNLLADSQGDTIPSEPPGPKSLSIPRTLIARKGDAERRYTIEHRKNSFCRQKEEETSY